MKKISILNFLIPAVLFISAGFFVFYPLTDPDIFWHLASGRELLARKAFLFSDPFSYTTNGAPWYDLHWFYQLTMYFIYKIGGYSGLLIFHSVVLGCAVVILFRAAGKSKRWDYLLAAGFLVVLFQEKYLIPVRPILYTLLSISIYIYVLEKYSVTGKYKYLLMLVPVQIFWVNSQGLFMLGPVIYLSYLAGESFNYLLSKKPNLSLVYKPNFNKNKFLFFSLFSIVILSVNLINPYGYKTFAFALKLFNRIDPAISNIYSRNIIENMPLLRMIGTEYNHYVVTFLLVTLVFIVTTIFSLKQIRFSHLIMASGFLLLAYMAQRNLILYSFVLFPAVCWNVRNFQSNKRHFALEAVLAIVIIVVLIKNTADHWNLLNDYKTTIAPFTEPSKSVAFLKEHPIDGNIFNADRFGGYLIWKMYPSKKVFIDTRLTIRSKSDFAGYLEILDKPELIDSVCIKFGITQIILPVATTDRYLNLARSLYRNPKWKLVLADGAEVLFVADSVNLPRLMLNSKAVVDSIAGTLYYAHRERYSRESLAYFGRFLKEIGEDESAKVVIKESDEVTD